MNKKPEATKRTKPAKAEVEDKKVKTDEKPSLHQALQQLESELSSFGTAREQLDQVSQQVADYLKKWEEVQTENLADRTELIKLIEQQKELVSTQLRTAGELGKQLLVVAKAVDEAGFPHRLETIQLVVANSQTTIQNLQTRLDKQESHLDDRLKVMAGEFSIANKDMSSAMQSSSMKVQASLLQQEAEVKAQLKKMFSDWTKSKEELQTTIKQDGESILESIALLTKVSRRRHRSLMVFLIITFLLCLSGAGIQVYGLLKP